MLGKLFEHKSMEYQFYVLIILVSIYYTYIIDIKLLLSSESWFNFRWLPLILLIFSGIVYKISKYRRDPKRKLLDSIKVVRQTVLNEGGKISIIYINNQIGEKFQFVIEYSEGHCELFTVERKVIIDRKVQTT